MKKAQRKYRITMEYSEKGGTHTISEAWTGLAEKAARKTLCEALDLFCGKDGPEEPSLEKLELSLGRFADKAYVESEFRRMKKAWKGYSQMAHEVFGLGHCCFIFRPDSRTELRLAALPEPL